VGRKKVIGRKWKVEKVSVIRGRRKKERGKRRIEIKIHAHVGKETKLAKMIPRMNDSEIHSKGIGRFYPNATSKIIIMTKPNIAPPVAM